MDDLTAFDIFFFGSLGVFALLGLVRGFVTEILGLMAWVGGIVAPHCANIGHGETWESVRVDSTHVGLAWSHEVLAVTADRLAQPEGEWRPYGSGV